MINLLNKLLARFGFQLVSIKPDTTLVKETVKFLNTIKPEKPDTTLVKETVKFLNTIPKGALTDAGLFSTYVGDINYVKEKVDGEFPQVSGKTYYEEQHYGTNKKYFNYEGEKLAPEELAEKLKND